MTGIYAWVLIIMMGGVRGFGGFRTRTKMVAVGGIKAPTVEQVQGRDSEGLLDLERQRRAREGPNTVVKKEEKCKIGIIGGGLAGLVTAMDLAQAQFLYASDIVHQGVGSVSALGSTLINAPFWSFWWD